MKYFVIIAAIIVGVVISGGFAFVYAQMYDCLHPPGWIKMPKSDFKYCWGLFVNGNLPDYPSDVSIQLKPYDYEDVCGFPVTDEMRLNVIYEESTGFTRDGIPFFTLHPGNFTHVELSQYYEHVYPSLEYWFTLKNGKQVYFKIGACDIDNPHITLGETGSDYLKLKPPTGESKYEQISVPGFPLVNMVTMQPVLDLDNCQRFAEYYTKMQSDTMFTRENTTFDPLWKNQVFPLMDYCTDIGNYELNILDGKINWSFTVK